MEQAGNNVNAEQYRLYLSRNASEENLTQIPSDALEFTVGDSFIELDNVDNTVTFTGDKCFVYREFDCSGDGIAVFRIGADWFITGYLNGEEVFLTKQGSNALFKVWEFEVHCRKGRNLLTFEIGRGRATSLFFFGEGHGVSKDVAAPVEIEADPGQDCGGIKFMNAINNAPVDQTMKAWQEAKISYVRNHDASISGYGSAHLVDVHMIFPDFDKDPYDPASYDFVLSDKYHKLIIDGGSKIFYRLGSRIEHEPKKYGTIMPPDFKKWAVICEHIIRHYTEGWADGFNYDIEYWEIWNEADMSSGEENKRTWSGTDEEFFEMYRITALHLKKKFPHLKIGGPALACSFSWMKDFLAYMTKDERVPIDFFSWHIYGTDPDNVVKIGRFVDDILEQYGYGDAENILNEWNYIRSGVEYSYNPLVIHGMKGAAFAMSAMLAGQNSTVDMLMYYDARNGTWYNGIFDFYTREVLKTYYDFVIWSKLLELGRQFKVEIKSGAGIYAVGATDGNGRIGIAVSRYFDDDDLPPEVPVSIRLKDFLLHGVTLYLLDHDNDLTKSACSISADGILSFSMKANSVVYIENVI